MVCEPCPLGMVGHLLGGCRACSPGTYRDDESSNCSTCEAGTYSGYGFPTCAPCKQGEYSNGVGSTECRPCASGSYSKKRSSFCVPCEINTASNLSMQHACPNCPVGSVAPFSGMTHCFPCPVQHNASIWISLVAQRLRRNASEAELLLAAATVDASCFQTKGGLRDDQAIDTVGVTSTVVIAIICTVAVIILILGVYFMTQRCTAKSGDEGSKDIGKELDADISIADVPENVRTNMMVKWGGQYFYQLLQGRRNTTDSNQRDIEMCSIGDSQAVQEPVEPIYSGVPRLTELITLQMARNKGEEVVDNDISNSQKHEPSELHCTHVSLQQKPNEQEDCLSQTASLTRVPLAPIEELNNEECDEYEPQTVHLSELHRDPAEFVENSIVGTTIGPEPSCKLGPSDQPQQYQGKKYSIDLENVRSIQHAGLSCSTCACMISRSHTDKIHTERGSEICCESPGAAWLSSAANRISVRARTWTRCI